MSVRGPLAGGVLAVAVALAPAAFAQSAGEPALEADAFRNGTVPTVVFRQTSARIGIRPPELTGMIINRPSRIRVATPPPSGSLGYLRFQTGDAERPMRHQVGLRRRAALGDGRYTIANSAGARVVLSTRTATSFVRVNLPPTARYVAISLTGAGARLLRFRGTCATQRFTAGFVFASERTALDTDVIAAKRLRGAGLCR